MGFNKKKLALQACSLLPLSPLLRLNPTHSLFVPIYHAISDEPLAHLDYIMPYGSKTSKQFEQDLDTLLKHFRPIDIQTLIHCIQNKKALPSKSFLITFDDGLRHVYENAAPILERKGIPAVFFINNAAIDNEYLLFRYKTSLILSQWEKLHTNQRQAILDVLDKNKFATGNENIANRLNLIRYQKRDYLDTIGEIAQLNWSEYLKTAQPFMTRAQILDLKTRGFGLGGHTIHHPELWLLEEDEAINEICQSSLDIKRTFGLNYSAFAFPFTEAKITKRFLQKLSDSGQCPDILFGSQKLQHDTFPALLHRYDGDNNMVSMQTFIKALNAFQIRNNLRNSGVFNRPN